MILTPDQTNAIRTISNNKCSLLVGPAGTGKSTVVNTVTEECRKKHLKYFITGTTNDNAKKINGTTINSLLNTFDGSNKPDYDKLKFFKDVDILIVDEVSMLSPTLLEYLFEIWNHFKQQSRIVFLGDFGQLSPARSKFAFESPVWDAFNFKIAELLYPCRQRCLEYYRNLLYAWIADSRCIDYFLSHNQGHILSKYYTAVRNKDVMAWNKQIISQMDGELHYFDAEGPEDVAYDNCVFDRRLYLKKGAYVRFVANDNIGKGISRIFTNGSIGVITRITNNQIYVYNWDSKLEFPLWKTEFWVPDIYDKDIKHKVLQYPIRPVYGTTLYKLQGSTLDSLNFNTANLTHHAQAYMGLSRVRRPEDLHLIGGLKEKDFVFDKRVADFYSRNNLTMDPKDILRKIAV